MNYSKFENLDQFTRYFNLDSKRINESKKGVDKLEVIYSKYDTNNIFKTIILFTNDKNPKTNKTLKNIYYAIKNIEKSKKGVVPKLYIFTAADTIVDDDKNIIIKDNDDELIINEQSNIDTLVISRLGVQGEDNCEYAVSLLQDRGFLILNPNRFTQLASNKGETAILFEKNDIPQPNYCIMNKSILYNEDLFTEAMNKVNKQWSSDNDKNEEVNLVVKIMDGHGGTGVFLTDGKKLIAILQTIFAIDPEIQLLIQNKEEADGGDIRVHVLTLRTKQVIMGVMKRTGGKDFRSNVSLGATAEKYTLTPEQEQIALKTAKISKMPWCAVDILPLVKGSNKELGDNVVLEINASPGTSGISEALDKNFVNILLNELNDPKEFKLQDKIASYKESATVDFGDNPVKVTAILDSGNGSHASHIEVGNMEEYNGKVKFTFMGKKYDLKIEGKSNPKVGDDVHDRIIVNLPYLRVGKRVLKNIKMGLVEKRDKSTNMLINRECLSMLGYIVSSNEEFLLSEEMEKQKII